MRTMVVLRVIVVIIVSTVCVVSGDDEVITPKTPTDQRMRPARRGSHRNSPFGRNNSSSQVEDSKETISNEDALLNQAISLLQRLNDRLAGLQALDEQQIRRLEALEYRLTKLEVQQQEKADSVRAELREVSRRVQQQDWQASRADTVLEALKLDVAGVAQGIDHLRGMLSQPEIRYPSIAESDIKSKLQNLIGVQLILKGATAALNEGIASLGKNLTRVINMTQGMFDMNNKLVTKQHLKTIMLDFQEKAAWTFRSIPLKQTTEPENLLPFDCFTVQERGQNLSGMYRIQPPHAPKPFYAYCDMETLGGGWTVLQNRYEGTVDFNRGWEDYKQGFGNLAGESWIGLENMYHLTNYKVNELLVELTDFSFTKTFARYSAFAIGEEIQGYPIKILGGYDGDAGDSLIYHAGMKFSTFDMDNDGWSDGNCAEAHTGAWWYNGCDTSNLNGRYLGGELGEDYEYQGMYWYDWHGPMYSLMKTRMAVRPSKKPQMNIEETEINRNKSENGRKQIFYSESLPLKENSELTHHNQK